MMTLPPVYSPADVENRWYPEWEKNGFFQPDPDPAKKTFTIVIPPPNVTGILHMGHALNNTLQDILIRWKRMQGYAALWVPGTDHAGIATQNVVERQLAKEKITRQQLGREKFIERVWEWKEKYGSTIVQQLRRLGSSCDWSHERFTMDPEMSKAVVEAFKRLHDAGFIYRDYRMVNWCPRCQTALSDEEVVHEEVQGDLWYIRYPAADGGEGVVVATTRPETMLGDTAVAVNPDDKRYTHLKDKSVLLPLADRKIPIIFDDLIDQAFGTGAVKITPAHDPVDFEIAKRHAIPDPADPIVGIGRLNNVMLPDGRMTNVPSSYDGLDRFECRKRVIEDLEKLGFLEKTEDYKHSVGHCYRCKTIIEPRLSPQWFVKMQPLAKLGIEAVEKDGVRFVPDRWTKVYLDWLHNIRDWCISRQIWWGHRIPVWYCIQCDGGNITIDLNLNYKSPNITITGEIIAQIGSFGVYSNSGRLIRGELRGLYRIDRTVLNYIESYEADKYVQPIISVEPPSSCPRCGSHELFQDPDVLDTWFSSWLWPFSTLGWPEKTKDLAAFYPTSVIVTGQDIIFFWVARMVMAGKFFLKQVPFKDVCIHGIIRVEGGKKMSKSLGNIIDPLEIIDKMGADALRFSIAHMASEGQDLYLSENKFLLGRNFANKLWNASRLILEKIDPKVDDPVSFNLKITTLADRWILGRLQWTIELVTKSLSDYHFNNTAQLLYGFVWNDFCDWYLEIAKLQREDPDAAIVHNTNHILLDVLETTLRLLHPFMPFITEELRNRMGEAIAIDGTIMKAPWPTPNSAFSNPNDEYAFKKLQTVITEVRNIRATFHVPVKEKVTLFVQGNEGTGILSQHEKIIQRLGAVGRVHIHKKIDRPAGSVVSHLPVHAGLDPWEIIVPLSGLVDLAVERQRIQKEVENLESRMKSKQKRLDDPTFRAKAPAEILAEEETSVKELETERAKWSDSLKQIH